MKTPFKIKFVLLLRKDKDSEVLWFISLTPAPHSASAQTTVLGQLSPKAQGLSENHSPPLSLPHLTSPPPPLLFPHLPFLLSLSFLSFWIMNWPRCGTKVYFFIKIYAYSFNVHSTARKWKHDVFLHRSVLHLKFCFMYESWLILATGKFLHPLQIDLKPNSYFISHRIIRLNNVVFFPQEDKSSGT